MDILPDITSDRLHADTNLPLHLIQAALDEDAVSDDLTAIATIPADMTGSATIRAKAAGVLSGVQLAKAVFC